MTITPTNAEGIAAARAALGRRTAKRPPGAARRLACILARARDLEAAAAAFTEPSPAVAELAAHARAQADELCLEADLLTHLEAAVILGGAS